MATEDFTTYTEVEGTNATITIDTNTIDADNIRNDEPSYVYKDFDANYFDGDFEFLVNFYMVSWGNWAYHGFWALANAVGDLDALGAANENYEFVQAVIEDESNIVFKLGESDGGDGGTIYTDAIPASPGLSEGQWYYLRVKRDEAVGTYGTLYCDIYTSSADRTNEANAVDNLSIALHTAKRDWRYLYGMCNLSHEFNSIASSYDVEDLEIISPVGGDGGGSTVPSIMNYSRRRFNS